MKSTAFVVVVLRNVVKTGALVAVTSYFLDLICYLIPTAFRMSSSSAWFSATTGKSETADVLRISLPLDEEVGPAEFLRLLARRFGLDDGDIAAFQHDGVVYPASYVANTVCEDSNPSGSSSSAPLELILKAGASNLADAATSSEDGEGKEEEDNVSEGVPDAYVPVPLSSDFTLPVRRTDLQNINFLRLRTRLHDVTPEEIYDVFVDVCEDSAMITKATYDDIVSAYFMTNPERKEETKFFQFIFSKVFYAFDSEGVKHADVDEVAAALGFLTTRSAREKMQSAFTIFDADDDGYLSPSELKKLLRAALTLVLSLNEHMSTLSAPDVNNLIDATTEGLVQKVYVQVRGCDSIEDLDAVDCLISYGELEFWHRKLGGQNDMPWITIVLDDALSEGSSPRDSEASTPSIPGVVFEFELGTGCGTLRFLIDDVKIFSYAVRTSEIVSVSLEEAWETFRDASSPEFNDGDARMISKEGFQKAVRALVMREGIPAASTALLSAVFGRVFEMHDRAEDGMVDLAEIFGSFSIFLSGSKSEKLAGVFSIFADGVDGEGEGTMSAGALATYMRSFLTGVIAVNQSSRRVIPVRIYRIIDRTCTELVHTILDCVGRANAEGGAYITFEDFGNCYNEGLHDLISWVELLDVNKWVVDVAHDVEEERLSADHAEDGDDEDDAEGKDAQSSTTNEKAVFAFCLTAEGDTLAISQFDCDRVRAIRHLVSSNNIDPSDIHESFSARATNGAVSKSQFDDAVRSLISGDALSGEEKKFLSRVLSNMFYAYDREGSGTVRLKELVCGMSILSEGGKSDKLALGFRVFDADCDSELSEQEFARFLRSFLTVLFALNRHASQCTAEDVWGVIDESALQFASKIFEECDLEDGISFEEFADWYSGNGYELLPWLELLCLEKFPGSEDGANVFPADDGDDSNDIVFKFPLTESGDELILRERDVLHLQHIVASSSLFTMEPSAFVQSFLAHSKGESVISKSGFF